jgi:hypothetical protein
MRQLQADMQIIGRLALVEMASSQMIKEFTESCGDIDFGVEVELIGIRTTVLAHGEGLTAPDQLRTAAPETPPPAQGIRGRQTVFSSIPALHRMNRKTVSNDSISVHKGLSQRTCRAENFLIAAEFRRESEPVLPKLRQRSMAARQSETQAISTRRPCAAET